MARDPFPYIPAMRKEREDEEALRDVIAGNAQEVAANQDETAAREQRMGQINTALAQMSEGARPRPDVGSQMSPTFETIEEMNDFMADKYYYGGDPDAEMGGPLDEGGSDAEIIDIAKAVKQRQDEAQAAWRRSQLLAGQNPDQVAQDADLARNRGVTPIEVEQNRDTYKAARAADELDALTSSSPRIGRWIDRPENFAVAHDDAENLSWWEETGVYLQRSGMAARSFVPAIQEGLSGTAKTVTDVVDEFLRSPDPLVFRTKMTAAEAAYVREHGRLPEKERDPDAVLSVVSGELGRMNQAASKERARLTPVGGSDIEQGLYSGIQSFLSNAPGLALSFVTKTPVPATLWGASMETGHAKAQADEAGLSTYEGARYALTQGAIEYATERLPMGMLFGKGAQNTPFGRKLARMMMAEIPSEQAATVLQDLNEFATLRPDAPLSEYLAERPSAAVQTLVATMFQTTAQTTLVEVANQGAKKLDEQNRQKRSEETGNKIAEIAGKAQDSKLLKRDPEKFREAVGEALAGEETETIRINPEGFAELAQSSNKSFTELEQAFRLREGSIESAIETGQDVQIRTADYATAMGTAKQEIGVDGGALNSALAPFAKMREDDYTLKELERADEAFIEAQKALESATEDGGSREEARAKLEEVISDLVRDNAPFDANAAGVQSDLISAMVSTFAERIGVDPVDFFSEFGFDLQTTIDPTEQDSTLAQADGSAATPEMVMRAAGIQPSYQAGYEPRDLILMFNDGMSNAEMAAELEIALESEGLTPNLMAVRMSQVRSKLRKARENEEGYARVVEAMGISREEADSFIDNKGRHRSGSLSGEIRRMMEEEGVTENADLIRGARAWLEANNKKANADTIETTVSRMRSEAGIQKPKQIATDEQIAEILKRRRNRQPAIEIAREMEISHELVRSAIQRARVRGEQFPVIPNPAWEMAKGRNRELAQDRMRGSARVAPDQRTVITMFESANLSTLAHEASHWWLDALFKLNRADNPSAYVQEQVAAVLEWKGYSQNWDAMFDENGQVTEQGRELQESFAETFEAYLREGKAPSARLRGVFAAFKQWLSRLYRSLRSVGTRVNLNEEITDVFDRMLASEDAIRQVRAPINARAASLADTLLEQGKITEAAHASMKERIARSMEEAEAQLMSRLMADYERTKRSEWRAQERQVRAEVVREVDARPEQRAYQWLSGGVYLGERFDKADAELRIARVVQSGDPMVVQAKMATSNGSLKTSWGAKLNYRAGKDMIVEYGDNDFGVVRADIFEDTYVAVEGGFIKNPDLQLRYFIAKEPMTIDTLEGKVKASVGDYIMIGTRGEQWPVRPEKFAARYEDAGLASIPLTQHPDSADFINFMQVGATAESVEQLFWKLIENKRQPVVRLFRDQDGTILAFDGGSYNHAQARDILGIEDIALEHGMYERWNGLDQTKWHDKSGSAHRPLPRIGSALPQGIEYIGGTPEALERARAQGFDVDRRWYRYSSPGNVPPDELTPRGDLKPDADLFRTDGFRRATFLANRPDIAESFGSGRAPDPSGGVTTEALLRGDLFNPDNPKHLARLSGEAQRKLAKSQADGKLDGLKHWSWVDIETGVVRKAIEEAGFDGAVYKVGDDVELAMVFDPKNIRSRFAKFDPEKTDSANLLAQFDSATRNPNPPSWAPGPEDVARAEQLEQEGVSPDEIWREVGLARTLSGEDWIFAIPGEPRLLKEPQKAFTDARLGEVLDWPELYEALPEFALMSLRYRVGPVGGAFDQTWDIRWDPVEHRVERIPQITASAPKSQLLKTIKHEVQHAIQEARNWTFKGNDPENPLIRYHPQFDKFVKDWLRKQASLDEGMRGKIASVREAIAQTREEAKALEEAGERDKAIRLLEDVYQAEAWIEELESGELLSPVFRRMAEENAAYKLYMAEEGEVQARKAEVWEDMFPVEKETRSPYTNIDVDPNTVWAEADLFVPGLRDGGGGVSRMARAPAPDTRLDEGNQSQPERDGSPALGRGNELGQRDGAVRERASIPHLFDSIGRQETNDSLLAVWRNQNARMDYLRDAFEAGTITEEERTEAQELRARMSDVQRRLYARGYSAGSLFQHNPPHEKNWGPVSPPPELSPMRLDLKAVRDEYGEDALKALPPEVAAYSASATDVDQFMELARDVRASLQTKKPKTLVQFLSRRRYSGTGKDRVAYHGIRDEGGELIAMIGKKSEAPGLIATDKDSKTVRAMSVHDAAIAAWEEGYFDGVDPPSDADFLRAISDELSGQPHYRPKDVGVVDQIRAAEQWEAWFDSQDVDIKAKSADLRAQLETVLSADVNNAIGPDQAAEAFGMKTGRQLLDGLKQGARREEIIRELTRQRMNELNGGDPFTDGTIAQEAERYARNELESHRQELELDALARASGKRIQSGAAKEMARQRLRESQVREVLNSNQWRRLEDKYNRLALVAAMKGDHDKALEMKRYALVNHHMYREASKMADQVEKTRKELLAYSTKPRRERLHAAGKEYVDQMDGLLDDYVLRPESRKGERARLNRAEWLAAQRVEIDPYAVDDNPNRTNEEKQIAAREAIEKSAVLERLAEGVEARNYKSLTVEEFMAVRDEAGMIWKLATLKDKLLKNAERRRLSLAAEDIAASVRENQPNERKPEPVESDAPGLSVGRGVARYFAMHRTLQSMARTFDGGKDGGAVWNMVVRPLNEAFARLTGLRREAGKDLAKLFEVYSAKERGRFFKDRQHFPGAGVTLTKQGRLAIALNWGNAKNRKRLMDSQGWDETQVWEILDTLDKRDWDFVQSVWDYLDTFYAEADRVHTNVHGAPMTKVEPAQIATRFGVYEGGYYPIKFDPFRSSKADQRQLEKDAKSRGGGRVGARQREGFTKQRVEGKVTIPLRLSVFDVITSHVDEVITSIATEETLLDVGRLVAHPSVEEAIVERHGRTAHREMIEVLKSAKFGMEAPRNVTGRIANHLRNGATVVGLGLNLGTALLQPLGLSNSIPRVGSYWIARGFARLGADAVSLQSSANWVMERSEYMRNRRQTQAPELSAIKNQLKPGGMPTWVQEATFFMIVQTQFYAVDLPTWYGQYEKSKAAGATEENAIAQADQAVIDAQGGGEIHQIAGIQRGDAITRLLTNFMSYMVTTYNLTYQRARNTNYKNPLSVVSLAADMALMLAVPVAGMMAINALRYGPPDEDEDLFERYAREQAAFLVAPFWGASQVGGAFLGDDAYRYRGPAGLGFFQESFMAAQAASEADFDESFWRPINKAAGMAFHYPAAQIDRTFRGMMAIADGETEGPAEAARALAFGPPRE